MYRHIHKANTYKVYTLLNHRVEDFCKVQYVKESYNTFSLLLAPAGFKYCKIFHVKRSLHHNCTDYGVQFHQ